LSLLLNKEANRTLSHSRLDKSNCVQSFEKNIAYMHIWTNFYIPNNLLNSVI